MFVGIIKTKDILLNPRTIISMRGVKGFMKLLYRALRKKPYTLIGMTQESDWIFDQKVQEELLNEAAAKGMPRKEAESEIHELKKKQASPRRHEAKKHHRG